MTGGKSPKKPDRKGFEDAVQALADGYGWESFPFENGDEIGRVATISDDSGFGRVIWAYDMERETIRCLLFGTVVITKARRPAIFELCARINQGLPFGCIEYVFEDDILACRDSADFDADKTELLVKGTTLRTLNLGKRYGPAIAAVAGGKAPETAVRDAEKD